MKVFSSLDPQLPLSAVAAQVRRLEALGVDGIHVPETVHDSLAVALLAVEHTTRVTVRTAVTLAFVRSPTLVAYAAWDLARLSGGRFELGLGSQIRQNIEGRYGMPWSEPVARMRDYVEALHALFAAFASGEPIDHQGTSYRITRLQPYFNPGPLESGPPAIYLGAVNARMCEVAGALADGIVTHPTNSSPAYLREVVLPALEAGAATAVRERPAIVAATTLATGIDDDAVARDRERQRRLLAFLYSTPNYRPTLDRLGWPDLQPRLQAMVRADDWDSLAGVMTDEVLDALLISGRYDELPGLLRHRYGGLADGVVLPSPTEQTADPALAEAIAQLRRS